MTQDESIEMAKQVGFYSHLEMYFDAEMLEAFAQLVAAKEREACWNIACEYTQKYNSHTCLVVADTIRARGG